MNKRTLFGITAKFSLHQRPLLPAGVVFDGRKPNPPPVQLDKSTSTRTPQQAIDEYLKSGEPTGRKIRPAAAPPSP